MYQINNTRTLTEKPFFAVFMTVVVLAAASKTTGASGEERQPVIVGYLPEYRVATAEPEQFQQVTDIIYFGLTPPKEGRLPERPIRPPILATLLKLKRATKCRLLVCVGGWDRSDGFAELVRDERARGHFIADLLQFCQRNSFDGVDFDWEHPRGKEQIAGYAQLLGEAKDAFHDRDLLVTVAQASWQDLTKEAYDAVDRVHLMSYDHAFPQATLEKSKADVHRLIDWNCPPAKICLGVPFYGRNRQGESRSYRTLVANSAAPVEGDLMDGFAINGPATVAAKAELAQKLGLGGLMVWELGQDASTEERSLLRVIVAKLQPDSAQ